jgi:hypothetical protein
MSVLRRALAKVRANLDTRLEFSLELGEGINFYINIWEE